MADVPVDKLPDYLREVPANKLPAGMPDREGELAAQAGPRGYTFRGQVHDPNAMEKAYNFVGGSPAVGATIGGALARRAVPDLEEGSSGLLSRLARTGAQVAGTGAGAALGGLMDRKDPTTEAGGAIVGELMGRGLAKGLGAAYSAAKGNFELSKYVGKVGEKMGDVLGLPGMRTVRDIYEALRYDPNSKAGAVDSLAGDTAKNAYSRGMEHIGNMVGEGATIAGDAAKKLRTLLYDHLPEFKDFIQQSTSIGRSAKKIDPRFNKSIFDAIMSEPLNVQEATELARKLTNQATKRGATGAVGKANSEFRATLANELNKLAEGAGDIYSRTNADYAKRMSVLRSFDAQELFTLRNGEPKFNRPAWIRASNDAQRTLEKIGATEIDPAVRLGRKPGAVAGSMQLGGYAHAPFVPGLGFHLPKKEFEYAPLRPQSEVDLRNALKKLFGSAGGAIGTMGAE